MSLDSKTVTSRARRCATDRRRSRSPRSVGPAVAAAPGETGSPPSLPLILAAGLPGRSVGPMLIGDLATEQDLDRCQPAAVHPRRRLGCTSSAPIRWAAACWPGWSWPAGRHCPWRIPAVLLSLVVGSLWGMWAGYHRGWRETVAMRVADVILSFPSLLLAVVVLYVFSPSAANIVLVLAVTRIPIYLRTARAESAELQSRTFVDAARTFGARADRDHPAPRHPDRAADAAHPGHPGLLLRHAGRVVAELPGHRHPAAGRQLGPDGRRRAGTTCRRPGGCPSSPASRS